MSNSTENSDTTGIGSTLTSGIQDVSALLPLLGTDQCERHVGSALEKGYLYSAATPMSIFGSLGIAKAGFSILLCCSGVVFGRAGSQWLADAGFQPSGTVASLIGLDDNGMYTAETKIRKLLDDGLHVGHPELLTVSMKDSNWRWNLYMVLCSIVLSSLAITPYIHVNLDDPEILGWAFPLFRITGGFIVVVLCQFALQIKLLQIVQQRLAVMAIQLILYPNAKSSDGTTHSREEEEEEEEEEKEFQELICKIRKCLQESRRHNAESFMMRTLVPERIQNAANLYWGEGETAAEALRRMESALKAVARVPAANKRRADVELGNSKDIKCKEKLNNLRDIMRHPSGQLLLYPSLMGISIGICLIIIGYVGCFTLIQRARSPTPYIWLGIEGVLCILRVFCWGMNPEGDEDTGLHFLLRGSNRHPFLSTGYLVGHCLELKRFPCMSSPDFFKEISGYAGPTDPLLVDGWAFYYTLALETGGGSSGGPLRRLYITCSNYQENNFSVLLTSKSSDAAQPLVFHSVQLRRSEDDSGLEATLFPDKHWLGSHPYFDGKDIISGKIERHYKAIWNCIDIGGDNSARERASGEHERCYHWNLEVPFVSTRSSGTADPPSSSKTTSPTKEKFMPEIRYTALNCYARLLAQILLRRVKWLRERPDSNFEQLHTEICALENALSREWNTFLRNNLFGPRLRNKVLPEYSTIARLSSQWERAQSNRLDSYRREMPTSPDFKDDVNTNLYVTDPPVEDLDVEVQVLKTFIPLLPASSSTHSPVESLLWIRSFHLHPEVHSDSFSSYTALISTLAQVAGSGRIIDGIGSTVIHLRKIGNTLQNRFDVHHVPSDITDAIIVLQQAARLSDSDSEKASALTALGKAFQSRFEFLDSALDISKAISAFHQVAEINPQEDVALRNARAARIRRIKLSTFEDPIHVNDFIPGSLFALVIGIDHYEHISTNLRGCVADANDIEELIVETWHVPSKNVVKLVNKQATQDAIITNLEALSRNEDVKTDDPILIYFAGYGGSNENQHVQMWLPYDFNPNTDDYKESRGILDFQFCDLVHQLVNAKGNNITVICDTSYSSHLGVNTDKRPFYDDERRFFRSFFTHSDPIARVRGISVPIYNNLPIYNAAQRENNNSLYILLSACEPGKNAYDSEYGRGEFTEMLTRLLRDLSESQKTVTYRQLITKIPKLRRDQIPRAEGKNLDLFLFRTEAKDLPIYHSIEKAENGNFCIKAGREQGIVKSSLFAAYLPCNLQRMIFEADQVSSDKTVLRQLAFPPQDVQASWGWAAQITDKPIPIAIALQSDVINTIEKRAVESGGRMIPVPVDMDEFKVFKNQPQEFGNFVHKLKQDFKHLDCEFAVGQEDTEFVFRVYCENKLLHLHSIDADDVDQLCGLLESATDFLWALRYFGPPVPMPGSIIVEAYELDESLQDRSLQPIGENLNKDNVVCFPIDPDGSGSLGFKIINEGDTPLYAWVMMFHMESLSISTPYSPETLERPSLPPHSSFTIGFGGHGQPQGLYIPKRIMDADVGYLKLFLTTKYIDMSQIEDGAFYHSRSNFFLTGKGVPEWPIWGTVIVPIIQVRKRSDCGAAVE